MTHNIYLYILVAGFVSSLIRILPLTLIRKEIRSTFWKSFLYYVPYVTLAVMTFPAIVEATRIPAAGIVALAAGLIAAWCGVGMLQVAVLCCGIVFVVEQLLPMLF